MAEDTIRVPLTRHEQTVVQMLAASHTISTRRNTFGLAPDDMHRLLRTNEESVVKAFIHKANVWLAGETVPARILYDDVLNRYVYLAHISARVLLERFNARSLYLFLYLYYMQVVAGRQFTPMRQLLEVVRAADAQNPKRQIRAALDYLIDYALVSVEVPSVGEDDEIFRVTGTGRAFLSQHLLQHATELVLDRNFEPEAIMEFFRAHQN